MKSHTHKKRILKMLEDAGEKGIHSFTLAKEVSFRASARILDLKKDGYNISSVREKRGESYGTRYFLI